jgi:hypothetical protein
MATVVKKKTCKRCHKDKPVKEFQNHPRSKDGKLGFCGPCWSRKMEDAAVLTRKVKLEKRKADVARVARTAVANLSEKRKPGRPKGSKNGSGKTVRAPIVHAANDALKAAGSIKDRFLVRANDGDASEFSSEEKALRQAMEWKMAGFVVTVWRQCEFEMVLRIIG